MKEVSIILPTYNQCERLKIVLEILKEQNYEKSNYEVIVVDDGSTDTTEQIVNSIESTYDLIYKKHSKNLGRSVTRNTGAEIASGELLIFMDSDRVPGKNFINEHLKLHKGYKGRVVIGNNLELFTSNIEDKVDELIDNFKNNEKKILRQSRYYNYAECVTKIYDDEGKTASGIAWLSLFSGNFSIKKDSFNEVGKFDINFKTWGFENFELGYRLQSKGYEFYYSKNAYNIHLYHGNNRKSPSGNLSYHYFYDKYNSKDIEFLLLFLNGKISLQKLEKSCSYYKATLLQDEPIMFVSSKFGSRCNITNN